MAVFADLGAQSWFTAVAPEIGEQKTLDFDMSRVDVNGREP
jgi:hypothetical protein